MNKKKTSSKLITQKRVAIVCIISILSIALLPVVSSITLRHRSLSDNKKNLVTPLYKIRLDQELGLEQSGIKVIKFNKIIPIFTRWVRRIRRPTMNQPCGPTAYPGCRKPNPTMNQPCGPTAYPGCRKPNPTHNIHCPIGATAYPGCNDPPQYTTFKCKIGATSYPGCNDPPKYWTTFIPLSEIGGCNKIGGPTTYLGCD